MSAEDTIRILLARGGQAGELDAPEWRRKAARVAWVRETMAAWWEAQRKVDEAWDRLIRSSTERGGGPSNEDSMVEGPARENPDDIPPPPEQAELDAIQAQILAVIDHDRWPRGLHFKGI